MYVMTQSFLLYSYHPQLTETLIFKLPLNFIRIYFSYVNKLV